MNKYWLSALIAPVVFSANAFGYDRDYEGRHEHRHRHRAERVVVHRAYLQPAVVYQLPAQRIYRDRVVYRDRPVYVEAAPAYRDPPPRYPQQTYSGPAGDRVVGQAIGAVAGAVIGNQFGHGNGRVISTAAGAVIGSVVGGSLSGQGY